MDRFGRLAHHVGIFILLVWGGVLIYFYTSGRIVQYLTSNAAFREQALIAGLVLVVLAFFNLLTGAAPVAEHAHDGEDEHAHGHGDEEEGELDAAALHAHRHEHEHGHKHGHEHGHEHFQVEHDHAHDHAHDHEGTFVGGPVAAIVLLAPILLAAFLTPDAFSARAVRNKMALTSYGAEAPRGIQTLSGKLAGAAAADPSRFGTADGGEGADASAAGEAGVAGTSSQPIYGEFTRADLDRMVDKSPEGNYMLELIELFYTAGDTEIQRVLEGLPMESVGQVLADTGKGVEGRPERLRIFRLYVECCAADARPLSIPVEFGDGLPEFLEMAWYRVTGSVTYRQENGVTVPIVQGEALTRVDPPEERMSF